MAAPAAARLDPAPARASCVRPLAGLATAVATRPTIAYRRPGLRPFARFRLLNANDYPTVFAVLGARGGWVCAARWYRVELPLRPNGVKGWIRARDVELVAVDEQIDVDLSSRRLVLSRLGRVVLQTTVAVGAPATPTPVGRYYVNQRLVAPDPAGAYGPAALGVSAFSNVLTHWTQSGPIGIHGTDEPWSIGRAASSGCIRVPNAVMSRLFALVPAGTPVVIHG